MDPFSKMLYLASVMLPVSYIKCKTIKSVTAIKGEDKSQYLVTNKIKYLMISCSNHKKEFITFQSHYSHYFHIILGYSVNR